MTIENFNMQELDDDPEFSRLWRYRNEKDNRPCYNCSRYGHLGWNCKLVFQNGAALCYRRREHKGRFACYKCLKFGHFWLGCPERLVKLEKQEQRKKCVHNIPDPWSDIPNDILILITKRLLADDVSQLGAVCKTWQQAVRAIRCHPRMPWLVAYNTVKFGHGTSSLKFHVSDFWNSRNHPVPKLLTKDIRRSIFTRNIGDESFYFGLCDAAESFSFGLRDAGESFNGRLFNGKLSWNDFKGESNVYGSKDAGCSCPGKTIGRKVSYLYCTILFVTRLSTPYLHYYCNYVHEHVKISRIMTTSPSPPTNFDIFVLCLCDTKNGERRWNIYTCNLRDGSWSKSTTHASGRGRLICGVAYKNGTFYCVFQSNRSRVLSMGTFSIAQKNWADVFTYLDTRNCRQTFLVEFGGDLLLACLFHYHSAGYNEHCFRVCQLNPSGSIATTMQSLGSRILILCRNSSSVIVPATGEAEQFANMIFLYRNSKQLCFISESSKGIWRLHDKLKLGSLGFRI